MEELTEDQLQLDDNEQDLVVLDPSHVRYSIISFLLGKYKKSHYPVAIDE